ncbi:MAG: hypothetical protein RJA22_2220 [Verrucomicrobiota bacterium]
MRHALLLLLFLASRLVGAEDVAAVRTEAARWRAERRVIDLHLHVNYTSQHLARAVKILDAVGVGLGVNLSGGRVTPAKDGGPSEFERNKALADRLFPGRFLHYFNLDYSGWDQPDFAARAVRQAEEARRLGAAGFKEYKRLGLSLRDGQGRLIAVDDPKLDPFWRRLGELGLPVSIHVGDPAAFWLPYDSRNERWKELKDHRSWWFGDTNQFPPRLTLLAALDRVVARHRGTTFVGVHFANNPEDLDWVEAALDRHPNLMADLAARIPELGRHDPRRVHRLFVKHQDRILFATDFMVVHKLILGSSGDDEQPTDRDAEIFYEKEWRWLETWDRDWPHMTPIQGDWKIRSIGLPAGVLRKVYFDNARRLLARHLPGPVLRAGRVAEDFDPDGRLAEAAWARATPVRVELGSATGEARPELSTTVRALWSGRWLYLGYECPFTELTVFDTPHPEKERLGLWDRDVVEAFIGTDSSNIQRYAEYEIAPTNERLDVWCDLPRKNFAWDGRAQSAVTVDRARRVWTCEVRIPLEVLASAAPVPGTRWRLNLYRCDKANHAYLAWRPTLTGSFHTPERFGELEFTE